MPFHVDTNDGQDYDAMSETEVAAQAGEALAGIRDAAFVMTVPLGLIVASTPAASALLNPRGGTSVGHSLEEFTSDEPSDALSLFVAGRLTGFEVTRTLHRPKGVPGQRVSLWHKRFDHQSTSRFALVLMTTDPSEAPGTQDITAPTNAGGVRSMLRDLSHLAGLAQSERQTISGLREQDLPGLSQLTTRELDMLTRLIAGYRVSSIAEDLVLSPSTVRTHLASIFAKLGVANQSDLISAVRSSRPVLGSSELGPARHNL